MKSAIKESLDTLERVVPAMKRQTVERARAELANLEKVVAAAKKADECFGTLISESYGVAGLHMNGDIAPWSEIDDGGRYEGWLTGLNELHTALENLNEKCD